MNEENFTLSPDGELVSPDVHDAKLRGVVLVDPSKLYIPLKLVGGENICMVLRGVDRLRADDFRQGNIVLDITVLAHGVEARDLSYVYGLDQPATTNVRFLAESEKEFRDGKRKLVEINASYGCSLACTCEEIEVIYNWTVL